MIRKKSPFCKKIDIPDHLMVVIWNRNMSLKSVLRERFHEFGDKTSLAGLNNAVHSKSNGKNCVPSLLEHMLQNAQTNVDFFSIKIISETLLIYLAVIWVSSVKSPKSDKIQFNHLKTKSDKNIRLEGQLVSILYLDNFFFWNNLFSKIEP